EAQVARLVAERVDVRPAVLHHRQDPGRARSRTVFLGAIRVAMPAVQRVEVTRLVRGMNRHPGVPWLLEVEDLRARDALPQARDVHDSAYRGSLRSRLAAWYAKLAMTIAAWRMSSTFTRSTVSMFVWCVRMS